MARISPFYVLNEAIPKRIFTVLSYNHNYLNPGCFNYYSYNSCYSYNNGYSGYSGYSGVGKKTY